MNIVPLQELSLVDCASLGNNVLAAWRRGSACRHRASARRRHRHLLARGPRRFRHG